MKKQESDAEFFCQRYDKLAMLVPGIIQDNHNWQVIIFCGKLMKKISDHLGINVGGVGQKFSLFGDSVITALRTFSRWRPAGDLTNKRVKHHSEHRNTPKTKVIRQCKDAITELPPITHTYNLLSV